MGRYGLFGLGHPLIIIMNTLLQFNAIRNFLTMLCFILFKQFIYQNNEDHFKENNIRFIH